MTARAAHGLTLTNRPPPDLFWGTGSSPFGPVMLAFDRAGRIYRLHFMQNDDKETVLHSWQSAWPDTVFIPQQDHVKEQLDRLFRHTDLWDPDIVLVGTPFQHKVWKALTAIPPGVCISYGDLARRIGKPAASRAVGGALGANPVPYLIPCHRVVAADRSLGGFSGGLPLKCALLRAEGITPDTDGKV